MNQPMPPPTTTDLAADQRVSTLVGDRLCAGCGYNLTGQPVWRERHYQMLIVRCPECGAVASVQEYPLLGRWASRWAMLLAGSWLIILLGMFITTTMTIFGLCYAAADEANNVFRERLDERYRKWLKDEAGVDLEKQQQREWQIYQQRWQEWFDAQDINVLFSDAGGWRGAISWDAAAAWIPLTILAAGFGVFWSISLLGLRRRGRVIFGLIMMGVVLIVTTVPWLAEWQSVDSAWTAASAYVGPRFMALSLVISGTVLFAALVTGRMLARGLIRGLLPPRLRGSLAGLWLADGLSPPMTTRARTP